jgi:UDP-N-acetylmuramoyl-tripeptide--D-alanyl-D-alanine ligase
MTTTIRELLDALPHLRFTGTGSTTRRKINGFSTDSRSLTTGEVFIALVGENFDGHRFIDIAAERGASAAIVSERWFAGEGETTRRLPLMVVADTLVAYGQIATAHRERFSYPVIAIAGSNGKTTTKELTADVLAMRYNVLRTEGNLNNLIGVPAMMLRMTTEHSAAVIEIGTNTPGEIAKLCEILRPTHGLITNIGREHLELLGSIEGVAREEGALFSYLAANGGTAFANTDDIHIARMVRAMAGGRSVTYGRSAKNAVSGRGGRLDNSGAPVLEIVDRRQGEARTMRVQLKTPGPHTAANALAAAAVGLTMKVAPTKVVRALGAFEPRIYKAGYARLATMTAANGARVLNDTYNANPDSVMVALETLAAMKPGKGGRRIVVLGDMKELGASSPAEHRRIGQAIPGTGRADVAIFHGAEMRRAFQALKRTNPDIDVRFFADKEPLKRALAAMVTPGDVVLVKGSRGMKMEEVVLPLLSNQS